MAVLVLLSSDRRRIGIKDRPSSLVRESRKGLIIYVAMAITTGLLLGVRSAANLLIISKVAAFGCTTDRAIRTCISLLSIFGHAAVGLVVRSLSRRRTICVGYAMLLYHVFQIVSVAVYVGIARVCLAISVPSRPILIVVTSRL